MTQVFKTVIEPSFVLCYLCLRLLFVLGNQHPRPSSIHYFPILLPALPPVPCFESPPSALPATHSVPLPGSPIPFPSLLEADVPSRREPTPPSLAWLTPTTCFTFFQDHPPHHLANGVNHCKYLEILVWLFSHIAFIAVARSPSLCTFICPPQQQPLFTLSTNFFKEVYYWKQHNKCNSNSKQTQLMQIVSHCYPLLWGTSRYFEILWGTLRYFEVFLGTLGYFEVLLGTLRYGGVLWGTLR